MRRATEILVAAGFLTAAFIATAPPVASATQVVVIQESGYNPAVVDINPGDTVTWRNSAFRNHTVTAKNGGFDSGQIGTGGQFAVTFNSAGEFPYYCTLHEDQAPGTVRVSGGGPPTSLDPTPTSPPATSPGETVPDTPVTSAPAASIPGADPGTTTVLSEELAVDDTAMTGSSGSVAPTDAAGTFTIVTRPPPVADPLAPAVVIVALLALSGVVVMQLSSGGASTGTGSVRLPFLESLDATAGSRFVAAALTILTGALHLYLQTRIGYPQPVGAFFLGHAIMAVALAFTLISVRHYVVAAAAVLFHLASIIAFWLSRTTGLFGVQESGWSPSPQAALSVGAEVGALVLCLLVLSQLRPQQHDDDTDVVRSAPV